MGSSAVQTQNAAEWDDMEKYILWDPPAGRVFALHTVNPGLIQKTFMLSNFVHKK